MDEGIFVALRSMIAGLMAGEVAFFTKTVKKGSRTGGSGQVYVPKDYVGYEALIVLKKPKKVGRDAHEVSVDEAMKEDPI